MYLYEESKSWQKFRNHMGKSSFCLWIFQTMGSLLGWEECKMLPWLGLTFIMPFPDHLLTAILSYQNMAGIWWFYQNVTKIRTLWGWCVCPLSIVILFFSFLSFLYWYGEMFNLWGRVLHTSWVWGKAEQRLNEVCSKEQQASLMLDFSGMKPKYKQKPVSLTFFQKHLNRVICV